MFHVYTFGPDSRQFLILTAKQAHILNTFTDQFFDAQERYLEAHGRRWTPDDDITFYELTYEKNIPKYNKLVPWLNRQHKIRNKLFDLFRIDVSNEPMDDYLIKRL